MTYTKGRPVCPPVRRREFLTGMSLAALEGIAGKRARTLRAEVAPESVKKSTSLPVSPECWFH
jgi:hypothetical protein